MRLMLISPLRLDLKGKLKFRNIRLLKILSLMKINVKVFLYAYIDITAHYKKT